MPQWTTQFEWNFPLGIPGVIIALLTALLLTFISYRFTPRAISKRVKLSLASLRFIFFITLIFCLCRPTITEKETAQEHKKKTIAVVIDESSSMMEETLSGTTRFETARTYWERNLKNYSDQYHFKLYQFGQDIRQVDEFKSLASPTFTPTQLYRNISRWNELFPAAGIDGVICMTDGVDTSSGQSLDNVIPVLRDASLPHAFLPISTSVSGPPYAAFRKLETARTAKINTQTPVKLVTSTSGRIPGEQIVLTVFEGQDEIYQAPIPTSGEASTRTYSFDVSIHHPGTHRYRALIQAGQETLAQTEWSIEGAEEDYLKVLLYQGGLDWGSRYLRGVFDRDSRAELTVEFAPGSFPARMTSKRNESHFPSLNTLSSYDVVIILKMRQEQIADEMESTLRKFVSNGGSLLFIIANTLDAQSYINSPLEAFLPVEFDSISSSGYDYKTTRFLQTMNAYRNTARPVSYQQSSSTRELRLNEPILYPLQLTEEGKRSSIFSYLYETDKNKHPQMPHFQDFALIRNRKPGARVLAVHPDFSTQGAKRILLAQQTFGKGEVAVLATDPLWRWKLKSTSNDASYDEFWKGFLAWLGAGHVHADYWNTPSTGITPRTPVECTLNISSRATIYRTRIRADLTDMVTKESTPLTLTATALESYIATFTPTAGHTYRLQAFHADEILAEAFLSCPETEGHKELQELQPDITALQRMAASSIRHDIVPINQPYNWAAWLPDQANETGQIKKEAHLWHKPWVFQLMLFLFLGELIIRRKFKLI